MAMNLVDYPQDAMYFHFVPGSEIAQLAIAREQNTAGMALSKREGKTIMNGEPWSLPYHGLRSKYPFAGKVDDLEPSANQGFFLCGRKLEEFIFKESVGNQEFAR
jgi:hypothetical protein